MFNTSTLYYRKNARKTLADQESHGWAKKPEQVYCLILDSTFDDDDTFGQKF